MRHAARPGLVALSALLALAAAGPAAATVDFFGSETRCAGIGFNRGETYPLFRGRKVVLTVSGFAVDNAKEVQLSSLAGVHAKVTSRRHGPGSSIDIELSVDADASLGDGEIRLRYDVEVAGFDRVKARVFDLPQVDSFSVDAAPGVSQTGQTQGSALAFNLVPGNLYTLVLKGKSLLDLRPRSPFASQGRFTEVSVLSASDAELKVRFKPVLLGSATIDRDNFRVEKLPLRRVPARQRLGSSLDRRSSHATARAEALSAPSEEVTELLPVSISSVRGMCFAVGITCLAACLSRGAAARPGARGRRGRSARGARSRAPGAGRPAPTTTPPKSGILQRSDGSKATRAPRTDVAASGPNMTRRKIAPIRPQRIPSKPNRSARRIWSSTGRRPARGSSIA